jgi:predicted TPR repeat methyltransferase
MHTNTQTKKQRAYDLLQNNQLGQAKSLFSEITQESPQDWEPWHMLSAIHGMLGEFHEAESCSRKVVALRPDFFGAHINLGNALMAQGKLDEAENTMRHALRLKPDDPQALNNLGNLLKAREKLADAEACYREALRYAPNYPDAHSNLGIVLQDQGKLDEAIASYQRAIQLKPDHADALYNIGYGLLAKDKLEAAAACFHKLIEVHPNDVKGWSVLGSTLGQLGKYDQAISCCERAISLQPDYAEAYCNLGNIYKRMAQKEKAAELYREALRRRPDMESARYFLATLGVETPPDRSPSQYVKELFDDYAEKFDKHLVQRLEYKTPELLNQSVRNVLGDRKTGLVILDLGCGTGLGGAQFRDIALRLVGVDLSPKMIQKAQQLEIYHELIVGDIFVPMEAPGAAYDLVIAADVFVYLGDLSRTFELVKKTLRPGGLFAFSTEVENGQGAFVLRDTGRYAHTEKYIRYLSEKSGMTVASHNPIAVRREAGNPVQGNVFVLRQPE